MISLLHVSVTAKSSGGVSGCACCISEVGGWVGACMHVAKPKIFSALKYDSGILRLEAKKRALQLCVSALGAWQSPLLIELNEHCFELYVGVCWPLLVIGRINTSDRQLRLLPTYKAASWFIYHLSWLHTLVLLYVEVHFPNVIDASVWRLGLISCPTALLVFRCQTEDFQV